MARQISTKLYIVEGAKRPFYHKKDAQAYCDDNNINFKEKVEVYDSITEYKRYLELVELEKEGKISNLERQVRREIISATVKEEIVKFKQVKVYLVYDNTDYGKYFDKLKEAVAYAKTIGIKRKDIVTIASDKPVVKVKTIEQPAYYTSDFDYIENGQLVVEDVKSDFTRKQPDYVLRRKLIVKKSIEDGFRFFENVI